MLSPTVEERHDFIEDVGGRDEARQRSHDTLPVLGGRLMMLVIGNFQRELDMATKQAPINALQAGTSMIAPFTVGGTSSGTSSENKGIGSLIQAAAAAKASDINLKENLLYLRGAVPGAKNGVVLIRTSLRTKKAPEGRAWTA